MTINQILESGLTLSLSNGRLIVRGSAALIGEHKAPIASWKPELIKVLRGESVADVGLCDDCGDELLGLLTFDRFINRVCPNCGTWFRCLEPIDDHAEIVVQSPILEVLSDVSENRFPRITPNARSASEPMIDTPQNSSVAKLSSCFNGLEPLQNSGGQVFEALTRLSSN